MQRALVDAAETIRGRASGMVVCIDEIQSADADGLRSLAYAWQQMQAENAELPLAIFAAGLSHSQDVMTSRWHKATDVEREFISAMAEDLEPQVKRGDIAERMGRPTTGISMVRRSLLDKGLIEESGFGYLRFTVPGFAEFVRNERGGQEREARG